MSLPVEIPTRPDPPRQGRRPHRAVVVGAGLLTVLGLAGAVTVAVVREDRESTAAGDLRGRLQQVATAQDGWRASHGSYTARLSDLRVSEREEDLAIVRADATGFCVGAYDSGTRTVAFYSPDGGFSATSCS